MSKKVASFILIFSLIAILSAVLLTATACDPPVYSVRVDIPGGGARSNDIEAKEDVVNFADNWDYPKDAFRGYTFNGIYDEHGNIFMDKDKKVVGKWKKKTNYRVDLLPQDITVIVNLPEGYGSIVRELKAGGELKKISGDVIPAGYQVKWYKYKDGKKEEIYKDMHCLHINPVIPNQYDMSEDNVINLYGEFEQIEYEVTFSTGKGIFTAAAHYGDNVFETSGYKYFEKDLEECLDKVLADDEYFAGWVKEGESKRFTGEIVESITLTPIIKKYNVVNFEYKKGVNDIVTPTYCRPHKQYSFESLFMIPEADIAPGYVFAGWYDNKEFEGYPVFMTNFKNDVENQVVTYYAKFEKAEYTLTFHGYENAFGELKYKMGDNKELPQLKSTEELKEFGGWLVDNEGEPILSIPNTLIGDHELYPCYVAKRFTIFYDTNGGETLANGKAPYGENYILDIPYKEGYKFIGWYDSIAENAMKLTNEKGESIVPYQFKSSSTFYAKWEQYSYSLTIKYVGEDFSKPYYFGEGSIFDTSHLTRDGYILLGVYKDNNCQNEVPQNAYLASSYDRTTFYAKWEKVTLISSVEDWMLLYSGDKVNYALANDIDFGGEIINSIPKFNGKFYGNGHKLSNFIINYYSKDINVIGLINENNGIIKDLTISNYKIKVEYTDNNRNIRFIGSLCGNNPGTIENCKAIDGLVQVDYKGGDNFVDEQYGDFITLGGIVGALGNESSKLINSYHNGTVLLNIVQHRFGNYFDFRHRVGGLAGEVFHGVATGCVNEGEIKVNINLQGINDKARCFARPIVGGIAGWNNANINQCKSNGKITITTNETNGLIDIIAGGITGWNNNLLEECVALDNITTKGEGGLASSTIGGLVGWNGFEARIHNSYAKASINLNIEHRKNEFKTQNSIGGFVGALDNDGTIAKCFADSTIKDAFSLRALDNYGGFVGKGTGTINNSFAKTNINVKYDSSKNENVAGYFHGKVSGSRNMCYYVESSILTIDGNVSTNEGKALPIKESQLLDSRFIIDVLSWNDAIWKCSATTGPYLIMEDSLVGGRN